jgi:DNA-binding protein Alba
MKIGVLKEGKTMANEKIKKKTDEKINDIKIGTESITSEDNRTSNVSAIEISLMTKKSK